jgi:molecular chaperone GrpE (heat shock protein)
VWWDLENEKIEGLLSAVENLKTQVLSLSENMLSIKAEFDRLRDECEEFTESVFQELELKN